MRLWPRRQGTSLHADVASGLLHLGQERFDPRPEVGHVLGESTGLPGSRRAPVRDRPNTIRGAPPRSRPPWSWFVTHAKQMQTTARGRSARGASPSLVANCLSWLTNRDQRPGRRARSAAADADRDEPCGTSPGRHAGSPRCGFAWRCRRGLRGRESHRMGDKSRPGLPRGRAESAAGACSAERRGRNG